MDYNWTKLLANGVRHTTDDAPSWLSHTRMTDKEEILDEGEGEEFSSYIPTKTADTTRTRKAKKALFLNFEMTCTQRLGHALSCSPCLARLVLLSVIVVEQTMPFY